MVYIQTSCRQLRQEGVSQSAQRMDFEPEGGRGYHVGNVIPTDGGSWKRLDSCSETSLNEGDDCDEDCIQIYSGNTL